MVDSLNSDAGSKRYTISHYGNGPGMRRQQLAWRLRCTTAYAHAGTRAPVDPLTVALLAALCWDGVCRCLQLRGSAWTLTTPTSSTSSTTPQVRLPLPLALPPCELQRAFWTPARPPKRPLVELSCTRRTLWATTERRRASVPLIPTLACARFGGRPQAG